MKSVQDLLNQYRDDFEQIESAMKKHFSSHIPLVNEVSEYILFSGGKRLRPLLAVISSRLCGRNEDILFDLSIVPEYLHAASLLHDDVIDEGTLRRGKKPAYKVWGNKAAVLSGDYLYARAIDLASQFGDTRIAEAISKTVAFMAEGEIIQLLEIDNPSYSEDTYNEIIFRKTASLISCACKIGALFAKGSSDEVKALEGYGRNLGMAFQIVDDLLDFTADEKDLGKRLGTDLAEGKVTLPVLTALKNGSKKDKEKLKKILKKKSSEPEDLKWVQDLLLRSGSLDYSFEKAERCINNAVECLNIFESSKEKELFHELALFVLKRKM